MRYGEGKLERNESFVEGEREKKKRKNGGAGVVCIYFFF